MTSTHADFTSIVARWEVERPDAVATSHAGTTRTWAELARRVRQVAAALRADGIGPGDRVAVLDLNHPSCLELTLACAQIGAANAVVNFRLAPPEIVYVIDDAQARLLFVGPEFAAAAAQIRENLPTVERVIAVPDEYEAWLGADARCPAGAQEGAADARPPAEGQDSAAHEPDPEVHASAPEDCFVQLYTSGTTGFPKGAMLTHRGMLAHATNVAADFAMSPDAVVQVAMPLFHVGGMSYALLAVTCGARMEMMRTPDPAAILEMFERDRVTHTFLVPALLGAMVQVPGAADRDYSSMRALSYGASPMPLPVMRASIGLFPGVLHQVYGMTEACGVVSSLGPEDHSTDPALAHRLVSAGTPIHGVEIEIRDPGSGEPVPTGEDGEIWVRTEQLMSGYWGRPEASAAAITPDGWLRTGDGGHMDPDGYVYVTDRIKDMIISGGENIYPAEIERVLAEHPAVGDVAVIGVPDTRWGEVPKAVVVAAPGATVNPDALLAYCRENLAGFKCPKSVDVLDELPRNPTGKILKKDLRKPYWEGMDRQVV